MSETITLCAMLVRHVFAPDDEARDEEMRRPFIEQAMRAKREHDEMRLRVAESDTTRREWEVRAAESWKVGRDVGRSTALADVTRCMTEVADVPDDCAELVTLIADTIARADRESRAAGLREAAAVAARVADAAEDTDDLLRIPARILALAPPAAETDVDRG